MPLRDHFHPPLSVQTYWTSFHGTWSSLIGLALNQVLPTGFRAAPQARFNIEIDVPTFDVRSNGHPQAGGAPSAGVATWSPGAPTQTLAVTRTTDEVEVRIYRNEQGGVLVGAIELVSPSNKHGPTEQNAFLAKCGEILRSGAGLVIVDIVTSLHFNFHTALLEQLASPAVANFQADLYATAYRPTRAKPSSFVEVWAAELTVGQPLPTVPLWLAGGPVVAVELEPTYQQVYTGLRLPG